MKAFTFAANLGGDELASCLHSEAEVAGFTVVDTHEFLQVGKLVFVLRRIEVHGKRKGEGEIAADMKARKAGA